MVLAFILAHIFFSLFLGRFFGLAPDEVAYLNTFKNLYGSSEIQSPQSLSGWNMSPELFVWICYLPAKLFNLIGISDIYSIRLLSIVLTSISLYLLQSIFNGSALSKSFSTRFILFAFSIPSIFLWSSLGLREAFIFVELALFFTGINLLFQNRYSRAFFPLVLGSYGLLSTKYYLWLCLMIAVIISCCIFTIRISKRQVILKFALTSLVLPMIAFASTTSLYELSRVFQPRLSGFEERTGYSVTQINRDLIGTDSGTDSGTVYGNTTLINVVSYLSESPDSVFVKLVRLFKVDTFLQKELKKKLSEMEETAKRKHADNEYLIDPRVLRPGVITDPLSMIRASFLFLIGPIPLVGQTDSAILILSLESPLWWGLYALVLYACIKHCRRSILRDPKVLFTVIFLISETLMSAMIEVNLGTAFRHRSILLVPLVFLVAVLNQRPPNVDKNS